MTNNLVLLLLSAALSALALFFPVRREEGQDSFRARLAEIRTGAIVSGVVLLTFLAKTLIWRDTFQNGGALGIALGIGMLMAIASASADRALTALPVGLAAVGAAIVHFLPEYAGGAQLALISGSFIAAFATGVTRPKAQGAWVCTISALAIVAANFLGLRAAGSDAASHAGIALAVAGLVGAALSGALSGKGIAPIAGVVLSGVLGALAAWQFLGDMVLAQIWVGGTLIAGVVYMLLESEEPGGFRFGVATIIWVAASTVAFGMKLGYGMAALLLAGAATLLILGSVRALMSMALALSVLVYRLFRELQPEGAKALDIGQHYSMIGICIGAIVPLLPLEWARTKPRSHGIVAWLWLMIMFGVPAGAAILLGAKGAVGLVVGLGLASLVEGMRGAKTLEATGIGVGLAGLVTLSYPWLAPYMDLSRADKTTALVIASAVLLLLGGAIHFLSRNRSDGQRSDTAVEL